MARYIEAGVFLIMMVGIAVLAWASLVNCYWVSQDHYWSWPNKITAWLRYEYEQPYSRAGLLLSLVGFLGSFAQATTRSILADTVGRIVEWVRNG
jgi:hypothetical protein